MPGTREGERLLLPAGLRKTVAQDQQGPRDQKTPGNLCEHNHLLRRPFVRPRVASIGARPGSSQRADLRLQSPEPWATIAAAARGDSPVKVREIIHCQTCNRDIENLAEGLVVWCTTKDKPGAPSIKVVHRKRCDPWKGNAPHSRSLRDFQDDPDELRRIMTAMVREGGMASAMAWEGLGRIYEGITEKDYFQAEAVKTS